VAKLIHLTYLSLGPGKITDIGVVANLTNLTTLFIGENQITDISAVAQLTNLQDLKLGGNQIRDISAVSKLTNLTNLYFPRNQIGDIGAVANLTNLTELMLTGNQITDIGAVAYLPKLTKLLLGENRITDINAVANLVNLKNLELYTNRIQEVSAAVANPGIASRDSFIVADNPLSQTALCIDIPVLEARGVFVRYSGECGGEDKREAQPKDELVVTAVVPSRGPLTGGQAVCVAGSFSVIETIRSAQEAYDIYGVYFGKIRAEFCTGVPEVVTATSMYVITPPGVAPGPVEVEVICIPRLRVGNALGNAYEYESPTPQ
jgi:hypothetical protein